MIRNGSVKLTASARLLLQAIDADSRPRTQEEWSKVLGLSRATVQRAFAQLEKLGMVSRKRTTIPSGGSFPDRVSVRAQQLQLVPDALPVARVRRNAALDEFRREFAEPWRARYTREYPIASVAKTLGQFGLLRRRVPDATMRAVMIADYLSLSDAWLAERQHEFGILLTPRRFYWLEQRARVTLARRAAHDRVMQQQVYAREVEREVVSDALLSLRRRAELRRA